MAMNNKNTPSGKSLKMSADDLKEMVKAAVAECLGEEKEDTPPAEETAVEGMDVMSVIEEAVEAAAEKRKARKEAGEEVPEEITPDEIIAEAAAILDGLTAEEEAKADDAETEEKSEEEVAEGKATKTTTARQTKKRTAAPAQRKYADIYLPRKVVTVEKKKIPADVQLARAVKCLDVFGRHDPEAAAYYAKKNYGDEAMAREFKAMSATSPSSGGYLIPEIYLDEIIEMLYAKTVIFELGARKVPMANGNLNIPKMTSGARATWGGEARKIAKSQPTFGNIKMSAKRLEAIVPQTRELLMSTNYSADALFANDLTRRMELGLDYGGMFGSGGEFQPLGIAKNKEVETVDATNPWTMPAASTQTPSGARFCRTSKASTRPSCTRTTPTKQTARASPRTASRPSSTAGSTATSRSRFSGARRQASRPTEAPPSPSCLPAASPTTSNSRGRPSCRCGLRSQTSRRTPTVSLWTGKTKSRRPSSTTSAAT